VTIALIHDLVVTEDYYVISLGPIDFDLGKFVTQYMTSRCSIAECMEYKPTEKLTTVHLVPRPGGKAGEALLQTPRLITDGTARLGVWHMRGHV
jgi:all-trans-8'-apo-beta-carotenal 15,15'-oxygenase